jgi:cell division septation protein DedD
VFSTLPLANGVVPTTSDTGSLSAELQTSLGRLTAFGRFTQRENVDSTFTSSTFTQRDGSAQMFLNLSRMTQLFGVATVTDNRVATGQHDTYLQVSAGGQQQLFRGGPWVRLEGSSSRSHDLTSRFMTPRTAVSLGLNGQIAPHTTLGLNVYADRAPVGFPGDPQAWLTRSTVRVVHTIPTGSVRVANSTTSTARAARGTGSVTGHVFADWNANGQLDPGEDALAGIPIALGAISHVTTGRDGQFSFLNVPAGAQLVRLDLNALPVDFDAPAETDKTIELSRGDSRRVSFGLLPLGGIRGRVYEDANRNGVLDAGEPPLDNAVVVLDGGQRSELARKGQFRFDAVRAGDHRLELLKESLPEGAAIVGEPERRLSIARDAPQFETLYLVTIDKRPEVRKVFPPRGGGGGAAPATASSRATPGGASRSGMKAPASTRPPQAVRNADLGPRTSSLDTFTVQVAALTDAANAREIVTALKGVGFDAYLVEPGAGDSLYRIRVGTFPSRAGAQRTVSRLETHLGLKLWVTKKR